MFVGIEQKMSNLFYFLYFQRKIAKTQKPKMANPAYQCPHLFDHRKSKFHLSLYWTLVFLAPLIFQNVIFWLAVLQMVCFQAEFTHKPKLIISATVLVKLTTISGENIHLFTTFDFEVRQIFSRRFLECCKNSCLCGLIELDSRFAII
jgi:hypothetical protein